MFSASRPAAILVAAGLVLCAWSGAEAAARRPVPKRPECPAAGTRVVTFARAIAGDAFLAADGTEVRLSGLLAPGSDGDTHGAAGIEASRAALEQVLKDRTVTLAFAGAERDRYGRLLAQVFADDLWVQAALLKAGWARAAPDGASGPCAGRLLAAEGAGRAARTGHWGNRFFEVLSSDRLVSLARLRVGRFEVVEGRVLAANLVRGRAFLNFGSDRKTDFSVTVSPEDMKAFRRAKLDPRKFAGHTVRVRGWVELYNGPEFEISTPEAIEVLDAPVAPPPKAPPKAKRPGAKLRAAGNIP